MSPTNIRMPRHTAVDEAAVLRRDVETAIREAERGAYDAGRLAGFEEGIATYEDLVGRREIAERAGASLATVDAWRRRHPEFPAPEWHVSGTPIWRWEAVERWIAKPRPSGRPRRAG